MLKKMLMLMLAMMLGCTPTLAEFPEFENQIPDEPIITENDAVSVTAEYNAGTDRTLYTIALKDGAKFPDGSAVTTDDLLLSWYAYLDPSCTNDCGMGALSISGLQEYRLQTSAETLANARAAMSAIESAGADHAWSASDGWSQELQTAYWTLRSAYDAACTAEYPKCAQAIVDLCKKMLVMDDVGAFGLTAAEVAANEGLSVAYAMLTWGYAEWDGEITLVSTRTRTAWQLGTGIYPTVDDFVTELKAVYGNDLAACWAVETTGSYDPALPDWKTEFLKAAAAAAPTAVTAIEGIRAVDEKTVEVELTGIDMRSEGMLLGMPLLSKAHFADAAQWNPEAGIYGHAFGDVSAIEAALLADGGKHTVQLMETTSDGFLF